jgi:short-subunit dehydrogenase/GT2 family glycosyltransferase
MGIENRNRVFISVVTFNHQSFIAECLKALQPLRENIELSVIDNASSDDTVEVATPYVEGLGSLTQLNANLGFCGANNFALARFLDGNCPWVLLLNPDLAIDGPGVYALLDDAEKKFAEDSRNGAFTGKVLRVRLEGDSESVIDTVGITFTPTLRHFDRGADVLAMPDTFPSPERVEGISGAFLLMHREFVKALLVPSLSYEDDVDRIYPELGDHRTSRVNFFDEAFFAYREDAELSLRASALGHQMWYFPHVVGYHHRRVTPSKRSVLPAVINKLSTRNRFLLQLLHFSPIRQPRAILPGFIVRNLMVVFGVLFHERTSLGAFRDLKLLWRRGYQRRQYFNDQRGMRTLREEFRGKVVMVTGASAGIGLEFAEQFHERGASLVLVARRLERLEEISERFNNVRTGSAVVLQADLADAADLEKVRSYISKSRVDILVNNAGRGSFGRFEKLSLDEELNLIRLNIQAPLVLSHEVIPQMKERGDGVIIMLSSVAGIQPLPYMATYGATKAFDVSFGMALAEEVRPFGIQVLSVLPGPVATEFGGVARVPGEFTNIGRDEPSAVVRESLSALRQRRHWIVPCLQAKALSWPSRVLPWRWTTYLTGRSVPGAWRVKEQGGGVIASPG